MSNTTVLKHPLVEELITELRDIDTNSQLFRIYSKQLTSCLLFEALKDLKTSDRTVKTQTDSSYKGQVVVEKVAFITILRAAIGMMSGAMEIFPKGEFHSVGIKRCENDPFNTKPVFYLDKLDEMNNKTNRVVVMDPMLATGGSMIMVLNALRETHRFKGKIQVVSYIAAEQGVKQIEKLFPDIKIFCAGLDKKLNDKAFIVPGLGDAGDRFFGRVTNLDTVR